jgi:hypothetical protein
METEKEEATTLTGWQYPLAAGAGTLIVLAYVIAAVMFLGYIMFLISRLYQWIIQFGAAFGLLWGVVLGILAFLGVLLATLFAILILVYVINKIQQIRLERKVVKA